MKPRTVGRRASDFKPTNPKDRLATSRLDLSLFPDTAVAYGALGMTEGDSKYGGYNYRVGGVLASVYVAATRRHLGKWFNGENYDAKTRVHHLASAISCIAILIDAIECGALRDDRPPSVSLTRLLTEAEGIVSHLHTIFPNGIPRYTEAVNGKKTIAPKGKTVQKMQESIATPKKRRARRKKSKRLILR